MCTWFDRYLSITIGGGGGGEEEEEEEVEVKAEEAMRL
jgi:hypothetical protein